MHNKKFQKKKKKLFLLFLLFSQKIEFNIESFLKIQDAHYLSNFESMY